MQNRCKWYLIAMLWLVCFLNYSVRQAIFALFPLLRVQFHLSSVQLALIGSSFMWAYAIFGPVAGLARRRLRPYRHRLRVSTFRHGRLSQFYVAGLWVRRGTPLVECARSTL